MGKRPEGRWRAVGEAIDTGMEVVVAIVIGTVGGWYLEQHVTHWSPWTTFLGFLVGVGAALRTAMRIAKRWDREDPPKPP